jgi:hypothetical protein
MLGLVAVHCTLREGELLPTLRYGAPVTKASSMP